MKLIERKSLVENFGYENGVEADDCWNTNSSSREEKGGKLYQLFAESRLKLTSRKKFSDQGN